MRDNPRSNGVSVSTKMSRPDLANPWEKKTVRVIFCAAPREYSRWRALWGPQVLPKAIRAALNAAAEEVERAKRKR